jgi:hypothetical protein
MRRVMTTVHSFWSRANAETLQHRSSAAARPAALSLSTPAFIPSRRFRPVKERHDTSGSASC